MPDVTVATGKVAAHGIVLVANQISTVTFADNIESVDIISDGTAAVFYTIDGSDPTIAGQHCYPIPAGVLSVDNRHTLNSSSTQDRVKLISAGTPTVTIVRA